ncbi:MAG TPA: aminotransferase class III-fold pyridoxal phosphate-dependent enzyme [Candidatus Ozemobacteraceae bacterium]|nr:aminotransferase class III-fold pyridoxal phosphate-dependent enzyme [Candidatus Ozemobacteraceae bacterium]
MKEAPHLKLDKSLSEFELAKTLVPGGVAGIRRPYNFVEGEYPIYFTDGQGCRVRDVDGNEYIDYLCAYGPIILGYREKEVDDAVIRQIQEHGFCFSLTQPIQNQLVQKLRELIPSCEMASFVKTGSDATTLATRVARCYTGRTKILRCGYHGWHDWCVEVKGGIPAKLYEDIHEFHYNRLDELEALLKQHGGDTAGIIVTPFGHPLALPLQEPKPGFLEGVRKLADTYGCVLIFDEIRSGFRVSIGGAQKHYGVTPDLSCFGKALANGYEIGALVGKTPFMKKLEKEAFVSSTFFPNSLAMVAALKTIEIMQRDKVLDTMWKKGEKFIADMRKVVADADCGAEVSGIPMMQFITFAKDETGAYKKKRHDFYAQLIRRGVFMQPYHHGYICHRHTEADLKHTIDMIAESLAYVRAKY